MTDSSLPGSEGEAAVLLDAYLAESHERAPSTSLPESNCAEVVGKSDPSRSGFDRPEGPFRLVDYQR
jgi:hypothetical protein